MRRWWHGIAQAGAAQAGAAQAGSARAGLARAGVARDAVGLEVDLGAPGSDTVSLMWVPIEGGYAKVENQVDGPANYALFGECSSG